LDHLALAAAGASVAVFPLPHRSHRNPGLLRHFRLGKVRLNALQKERVAQVFGIDWNELSGAKSASRKAMNDTDCPLCNTQQLSQPPLALAVPLSRFTSRVGRGSAFTLGGIEHNKTMKTWIAILFTIGLFAACVAISALIGFNLTWIMVLGTALWAAIDSSKIQFKKYKSSITTVGPVLLFFGLCALWILFFPWYLSMRFKIKTGTAILKDEVTKDAV
jgi:hypothetical protein